MSRYLFLLLFLSNYLIIFSQDNSYANNDSSFDKSYDTNEVLTIPLYTIKEEGVSIPIYLSYNTKGLPVTEVPSSVGFNWQLVAGGKIRKQINHLSDESTDGWFFNHRSDDYQENFFDEASVADARELFESVDASPDFFDMEISNGEFIKYLYDRSSSNYLHPVILSQSGSFTPSLISTDFQHLQLNGFEPADFEYYNDDNHCEIEIKNNQGVNYLFRKGIKRARPYDLDNNGRRTDSLDYQDYYLHKVKNDLNSKEIKFHYVETSLNKLIPHASATRTKTNSDPYNPPASSDPIEYGSFLQDISIEDVSRKDISSIVTDKMRVVFTYNDEHNYTNSFEGFSPSLSTEASNSITSQDLRLLDEIKIYDNNGNYITGYKFYYTYNEDPNMDQGDLKINTIIKFGKNHKDSFVYKKFDYYNGSRPSAMTLAKDVFGYYNGNMQNGQCVDLIPQCYDGRMPNESEMIKGMLKSITNKNGGSVEYEYVENSSGDMYYGGLLVSAVTKKEDVNLLSRTEYLYENPEGFGLPIFHDVQYSQGEVPPNTYEDGYFELGFTNYPWITYFTKIDPKIEYQNLGYLTAYSLSSIPYSYSRNTPALDAIFQGELQLQGGVNQFKFGSFYGKVTSRRINVLNGVSEKGYVVDYYRPSLSSFDLGKLLYKKEYYNDNDLKINEERYNYQVMNLGGVDSFKFDNVHLYAGSSGGGVIRYSVENNFRYIFEDVLKSTEILEFNSANETTKHYTSTFLYLNEGTSYPDYTKIKEVVNSFNGLPYEKINYRYLTDYQVQFQNLEYLQRVMNPVVEISSWAKTDNSNWKLKNSQVKDFLNNGKLSKVGQVIGSSLTGSYYDETNYSSSYYDSSENLVSLAEDFVAFTYNNEGLVESESNLRTQVKTIYQRSEEYDGLYVDAVLVTNGDVNLEGNVFLKKSFEGQLSSNVIRFDRAFSGKHVFNGNSLDLGEFTEISKVSFWGYHGDKWHYYSYTHNGGQLTITIPTEVNFVDEVRVQPLNSSMKSNTFLPLIGITSDLNDSGEGRRIEYDLFGNALFEFDKDYNILKENRYNSKLIEIND